MVVQVPPPGSTNPGPQQPAPVRPGTPLPRPVRPPTSYHDEEPINPGDLICGQCGAGNKPTRKFCRRCGHDLKEAVVARIPWWKRIFRRKPKVKQAGARPKQRRNRAARSPMRLLRILLVLLALAAGSYFAYPFLRNGVGLVLDRVQGSTPVHPVEMKASSEQPGQGADKTHDGVNTGDSYWAAADPGAAKKPTLTYTFNPPTRIVEVLVTSGVSSEDEEAFRLQGRPREVTVVLTSATGKLTSKTLELKDVRGVQRVGIAADQVKTVTLTVLRMYQGSQVPWHVAISEVEFSTRK